MCFIPRRPPEVQQAARELQLVAEPSADQEDHEVTSISAIIRLPATCATSPTPPIREICFGVIVGHRAVIPGSRPHGPPSGTLMLHRWSPRLPPQAARLQLRSPRQQFGFQELLSLAATRTAGRLQRLNDDTPAVPTELWLALILGGVIAVVIHFGMADPRERPSVHGLMVAGVAAVVATGLLLVNFLDHPFEPHVGGIQPTAMTKL